MQEIEDTEFRGRKLRYTPRAVELLTTFLQRNFGIKISTDASDELCINATFGFRGHFLRVRYFAEVSPLATVRHNIELWEVHLTQPRCYTYLFGYMYHFGKLSYENFERTFYKKFLTDIELWEV